VFPGSDLRKRKRQRRYLRLLIPLAAILAFVAAARALSLYRPFDKPATTNPGVAEEIPGESGTLETLPGDLQTFLVMGVDTDEGEYGRSDSMVVVSFDPKKQRLALLSVPRDLWTDIPGRGYDKINHAYAYGGPALAVATVERLLGIDIDHWISINFDGFVQVIDALGGVEVNPPKPLYYVDPYDYRVGPNGLVIDIKAGPQVMDGETALKYARFRNDAEGDLGRMRRQQEIIQAAVKKAASPGVITRAPQLISALYNTITTDLTVGDLVALATKGRQAIAKPLQTGALSGDAYMIDGVFYFGADLVELRTQAYELLVGEPPGDAFLEKARADNEVYQAALSEAYARSLAAAQAQEQEEGEGAEGDGTEGDGAETGEGDAEGDRGDAGEGENGTGEAGEREDDGDAGSDESPSPISVNLVDATGQGVAQDFVDRLEAAGFEVSRVHVSAAVLPSTVAVVRTPGLDVSEELFSVVPVLEYRVEPDPAAEHDIDLVLGTDVLDVL